MSDYLNTANPALESPLPGVYCIRNIVNGRVYIGKSTNLRERARRHRRQLLSGLHTNSELQSDFDRHGENSFCFEILFESFDSTGLSDVEDVYLQDNLIWLYNIKSRSKAPNAILSSASMAKLLASPRKNLELFEVLSPCETHMGFTTATLVSNIIGFQGKKELKSSGSYVIKQGALIGCTLRRMDNYVSE